MSPDPIKKTCPACAEEILEAAIKCKHCGELLGKKEATKHFDRYETWLKQNYPAYNIVSKDEDKQFIVLNKDYKTFSVGLFIILLILWVLPGVIYAIATLSSKKIIAITIGFNKEGQALRPSNASFNFLADKYNSAQGFDVPQTTNEKQSKPEKKSRIIWLIVGLIIVIPVIQFVASNIQKASTEPIQEITMFEFSETELRAIFKEVVAVEDAAYTELGYEVMSLDAPPDQIKTLQKKNNGDLAKRYGITHDQLNEITNEALRRGWPLD